MFHKIRHTRELAAEERGGRKREECCTGPEKRGANHVVVWERHGLARQAMAGVKRLEAVFITSSGCHGRLARPCLTHGKKTRAGKLNMMRVAATPASPRTHSPDASLNLGSRRRGNAGVAATGTCVSRRIMLKLPSLQIRGLEHSRYMERRNAYTAIVEGTS
jgi:hypothetical protein